MGLFSSYSVFGLIQLSFRNALILGILYMTFQAFPIIFENLHGFNYQCTGLAFLGIGFGMVIALATQPLWDRYSSCAYSLLLVLIYESLCRKYRSIAGQQGGNLAPESRLLMGKVGAVLAPIGPYSFASPHTEFILRTAVLGLFS